MKYIVIEVKNSKYGLNNKSYIIKKQEGLRKYPRIQLRDKTM